MQYAATALFERPVAGRMQRSTADMGCEEVDGRTPEAAALMWLHRMTAAERQATVRVILSASTAGHRLFPVYHGPDIELVRVGGRLERIVDG